MDGPVLVRLPDDARIAALARRVASIVTEEALAAVVEHEPRMRLVHLRVFAALESGPARASVVAARLGVSKQAVAPVIDELVEWGHLERVSDPTDGRAKLVQFTQVGQRIGEHVLAVVEARERRWRRVLGGADMEQCKRALRLMIDDATRE